MSRGHRRRLLLSLPLASAWVASACAVVACSTSAGLVGQGGACELASECQEGLVCVPDKMSASGRICSSDLSGIQSTEAPKDSGAAEPTSDGGDATSTSLPPTGTSTPDGSTPDDATMSPPTPDATSPGPDSSTPTVDSGSPKTDAGSPSDAAHD